MQTAYTHMDLAFVSFEATVFQCSACKLTSHRKETIVNHIQAKCPTAAVVHGRCALHMGPVQPGINASSLPPTPPTETPHQQQLTGDHNINIMIADHSQTINNITNHTTEKQVNIIYVGSSEEYKSLRDLVKSEDTVKALWALYDHEIPARVFEMWKGAEAPDTLKNIRVDGNKVQELRGPGNVVEVPRTKFVKKTIADILGTIDTTPSTSTAAPDKMDDIHATVREPRYRISQRPTAAPEVARMHQNAAPELRLLNGEGRDFLREAKERFDKVLDEPDNEFSREFPADQRSQRRPAKRKGSNGNE